MAGAGFGWDAGVGDAESAGGEDSGAEEGGEGEGVGSVWVVWVWVGLEAFVGAEAVAWGGVSFEIEKGGGRTYRR